MAFRWRIRFRGVGITRFAMADHRAIDDVGAIDDVAEPRGPDAARGGLAERGY